MADILIDFTIHLVTLVTLPIYFIEYFGTILKHFLYFGYDIIHIILSFNFLSDPSYTIIMTSMNDLAYILIYLFSLVAN